MAFSLLVALTLVSCGRSIPANVVQVTVTNRRPEVEKVVLILHSIDPERELQRAEGEVPANYSERFTIAKPAGSAAPMKLVLRTEKGDAVTILLDSSESSVARTIELTRDRKAVVSQN
jgi:hypothetical protein